MKTLVQERRLKPVSHESEPISGVTFRGVLIGLIFVAITCVCVCWAELVLKTIQIGFLQMPPAAIGIFFFLILLNKAMSRLGRRLRLSSVELLMIYMMMVVACMVSSRGIMEKVIPVLVTSNYYANPANQWTELFSPHIKKWMVAFDPAGPSLQPVARSFFEGLRPGESIPWKEWALPLACWGALVLLVIFAFLCIATIFRKQWVDNEKLSFPLVQLPLELSRANEGQDILKNKLLWGGAAVPAIVFTLNGIHNIFPSVPQITLSLYVNQYFVNRPWNEIYLTLIYLSFAAVGFFYLLPGEILFSLWFFALVARLQDVVAAYFGMEIKPMPMYGTHSFVAYQVVGAYVVLAGYLFFVAIPHLKHVMRSAWAGLRDEDKNELLPYPVAFWGLIVSFVLILCWCRLAGMSLWVAALQFFVFLFVVAMVMSRSTAEAGVLMTETSFRPVDFYRMFAPATNLGPSNLTLLAFTDAAFMRDQRGLLLTGFLDGLKIADGAKMSRASMRWVFVIGILSAMLIAGAIHIWLPYTKGAINLYSYPYNGNNCWAFSEAEAQIRGAPTPDWQPKTFFIVGMAFALFLSYMRALYYWWPLHPLGYALCISWTMTVFWFSCLIAWIIKTLFLRYGGMRFYVKARPWFLGMVLGEFGMAVIWALVSGITGATAPEFPWP
ncbi:MAG: hypothetical protein N3B12_06900 [Armatimonadetes bacterium]|nr:hypothetical protein [Armatimonadota bacterium]